MWQLHNIRRQMLVNPVCSVVIRKSVPTTSAPVFILTGWSQFEAEHTGRCILAVSDVL